MNRSEDQQLAPTIQDSVDSNELLEQPEMKNNSILNILLMSVGFLFVFTAFNTSSLIQKTIVTSLNTQQPELKWDAFASLCIIYGVFSFANFLVPSILSVVSSARCIFFASLTYLIYVACFLYPIKFSLYIVSIIAGVGAATIWVAQGNYLTENSDSTTIDRNTGIFWAIFQGSLVFGNLFFYFKFKGVEEIEPELRYSTYLVLTMICAVGCFFLLLLKKTTTRVISINPNDLSQTTDPLTAFYKCLKLFKTKNMLLLSVACFYSGLELSFYSGVLPSSIASTKAFGPDSKSLIGIYGVLVGSGSILGGLIFGLFGKRFIQDNRSRVFLLGFIVHMIAYFLSFWNLPVDSPKGDTYEIGFVKPRIPVALFSGFLLGFGDACFNTQIISLIGSIYTDDSNYTSSAFALYKFTQSLGASVAFLYSIQYLSLNLYVHLSILVVFAVLGAIAFVLAEINVKKQSE